MKTITSYLARHVPSGASLCLMLCLVHLLGFAQAAHAFDPQTTCHVRLWWDTGFSDPTDYNNTSGGNPPPGSKIMGTGQIEVARFDGSEVEADLDRFVMRVDNMWDAVTKPYGNWVGFAGQRNRIYYTLFAFQN